MSTQRPEILKQAVFFHFLQPIAQRETLVKQKQFHMTTSKWKLKQLKFIPLCLCCKLFHAKGFTLVLRDISKTNSKNKEGNKDFSHYCAINTENMFPNVTRNIMRLQMHKWSKCNTLSSEAPIKKKKKTIIKHYKIISLSKSSEAVIKPAVFKSTQIC